METSRATGMADRSIGRADELARVRHLLAPPGAAPVLVVGQAGVGKTTLLNDVASGWTASGTTVLRASTADLRGSQLHLWRRPAFDLGVELPTHDPSVSQPEQIWELTALLGDACHGIGTALLVADDLQWADASSLAVLRHLLDRLVGADVRVLGASRDSNAPGVAEVRRHSRVVGLAPLSEAETAQLAESLTGVALDDDSIEELHRRTGGIPLLVGEVVLGGPTGHGPAADVLQTTLRRAGEDALGTLSVLAVGGLDLPVPALASACGSSLDLVQSHLDRAVEARVLVDDEGVVRFGHDLLAEAAESRLRADERRQVSAALAQAWREVGNAPRHARHLVEALPTQATVDAVVRACEDAANVLGENRRSMDAATLVSAATTACARAGASETERARLARALGDAHWDAGDAGAAVEAFATGAALEVDDVELAARLEVGRHRQHNHFEPDAGRGRLMHLDDALGPGDSSLRVELLGRLAALAQQAPVDLDLAEEATSSAMAMARRLGSPGALAQALHDRFLWITSIDRLRERDAHAGEMVAVAQRAGRTDLVLVGLQWRLDAEVNRHDLSAAVRTVDESSVLADVSRRALWRLQALGQRARMAALRGDRAHAFGLVDELAAVAASAVPPLTLVEWSAHEMFTRMALCRLYNSVDPRLGAQMEGIPWVEGSRDVGTQIMAADMEWASGREEAARTRASRWLTEPDRYVESVVPMVLLVQMGRAAVDIQSREAAATLLPLLSPLRGRVFVAEQIEMVDLLLARLSLLLGEAAPAIIEGTAALTAARTLGSPVLEARCLEALGEAQNAHGDHDGADNQVRARQIAADVGLSLAEATGRTAEPIAAGQLPPDARVTILRSSKVWTISHRGRAFDVRATNGLVQLGRLLAEPGRELAATELAGHHDADSPPVPSDLGPALDAQAKKAYRRRLLELQTEMDDSDLANDPERSTRAGLEYDALVEELRRATGLGGRDRPQSSGHERARVNVTRSLRRAIAAVASHSETLGTHLQRSIRTGRRCCYEPDPTTPLRWDIRD